MTRAKRLTGVLACTSVVLVEASVFAGSAFAGPFAADAALADWAPACPTVVVDEQTFGDGRGETLAIPLLGRSDRPEMVWAQRSIDRQWSTRSDPDHPAPIPGWRSEATSVGLSMAVPGTGQIYAGAGSGYVFMLAEAAGWFSLFWLRNGADDLRDEASGVAGAPSEASSGWSAERWAAATGEDPRAIEALYAADPESYYTAIEKDSRYAAGWASGATQEQFSDLRGRSDHKLRQSRGAGTLLWLNHLASAADALRAARIHNLPLRRNLDLKATGGWRKHGPTARIALEGTF